MSEKKSFDTSLQDVVYSLDVGAGLKILRIGLYVLMLIIVVLIYTATQFWGLNTEEAMDLAQLGRNISFSDGLITKNISPMTIYQVESFRSDNNPLIGSHPNLIHPPGYPFLLSLGFKFFELLGLDLFNLESVRIMPAEQWVILPINHLFTMLTGWLIFSIGKHLFYREIGFISMSIYFLSDIAWSTSISGLNISMAIFFGVAAYQSIIKAMRYKLEDRNIKKFWIGFSLSLVLLSCAFYTRYITGIIVLGISIYLWLGNGRFKGGNKYPIIYISIFLILISPWLIRNFLISGNPLGLVIQTAIQNSPQFPDMSYIRDYQGLVDSKIFLKSIKEKWIINYSGDHQDLIPGIGSGLLMSFFITTFFYRFTRPAINYLRTSLGISLLVMIFLAGFFSDSTIQMVNIFWPFVILYGIAFFYILLDRLKLGFRLYVITAKCLIVAITAIPFGFRLMPPHEGQPYPPYHAPLIYKVSNMLTPREVICTDMPWATAWYGDRISILLPKNLEQYYLINDYHQYMSGLYFTTITKNKPFIKQLLDGPDKSWLPIFSGRLPPDFPLKSLISLNRQDQVFISDRERWLEESSN